MTKDYHERKLLEFATANIKRLVEENEKLMKENEELKANNDYIAMMTDVELPNYDEEVE